MKIDFTEFQRAGDIYIMHPADWFYSCYTAGNSNLCVSGSWHKNRSEIQIVCTANTWGLDVIPVAINANSICYR